MSARLRIVAGLRQGAEIEVPDEGIVLGRAAGSAALLGDDMELSREHAHLKPLDDGSLLVEDLDSANGTLIDGKRVQRQPLRPGHWLQLGASTLELVGVPKETPAGSNEGWGSGRIDIAGNVSAADRGVAVVGRVSGGVHTGNFNQQITYDASGLALLVQTRGPGRALALAGLLVGFTGFAFFAYPILRGIIDVAGSSSSADPTAQPSFHLVPWLPLGAVLFFAGIVLTTLAVFVRQKNTPAQRGDGAPPPPGRA